MSDTITLGADSAMLKAQDSVLLPLRSGRLGEHDPLGFDAGDDNLYRFVGNDPADEVDPTGFAEKLLPGAPGAPTLAQILGNTTIKQQLNWFRQRQGADGHKREEGGWVLFNTRTGQYILTVDGSVQYNKHQIYRNRLPTRIGGVLRLLNGISSWYV